ncbi:MAG: hypothetical protein Q9198_005480 [Flavoplaca austrocitrina]
MYKPARRIYTKRLINFRKQQAATGSVRLYSSSTTSLKRSSTIDPITPCNTCNGQTHVPSDLDIDRVKPLNNTVLYHNQHIVISTGKSDWESRIENENQGANLAKVLKDITKRTSDRDHSSYIGSSSLRLFPQFLYFSHLLPRPLHHDYLLQNYLIQRNNTASNTTPPSGFTQPSPITSPTILICSHASRDRRCGVLGPLLHHEFELCAQKMERQIDVAMISHVGGHAFAGNVIVYIPPDYRIGANQGTGVDDLISPLAGTGIWYGRVEPKHVHGLLAATVEKGNIIGELWRGNMDP